MNKKIGNYTVVSDNKFRPLLSLYELSEKESNEILNEYRSCPYEEFLLHKNYLENCTFFKYKKELYNLDEFSRLDCNGDLTNICDAVMGFSYFSGIGIKLNKECDAAKVFYFYC